MSARQPTQERQRQIADAALKVIANQGLGRFTAAAVAAEVGVSDATLFRHFASMEDIVLAALDRLEEALFGGFPPQDADPLVRLEQFFRIRAERVRARPIIARLAFSDALVHAAGTRGEAQVSSWKQRSHAFVAECLGEAAATGRLPPELPVREAALVVIGALFALVRLDDLDPAAVDRMWSVLARTFAPEPSPGGPVAHVESAILPDPKAPALPRKVLT